MGAGTPAPAAPSSAVAVTMGDPAGIGLEITLAAWRERTRLGLPPVLLFADPEHVRATARRLGIAAEIETVAPATGDEISALVQSGRLPVAPVPLARPAAPGRPDPANAAAVIRAIEAAVDATMAGTTAALVTNPIAKSVLYAAGFAHPGHTEFLAELAGRHRPERTWHPVMMLASDLLRVVPLTIHIPLADVARQITQPTIVATARILEAALRCDFAIARPRIAVAGLNPHAGESGSIGREDEEIVAPAVAALRAEGIDATGPRSADTLFHAEARRSYDAVLAMYHDQALIPIKTLSFDTGVNVTLGLPFVRTSPDHGTAFDIAGSGRASPGSLVAALRMAAAMAERRRTAPAS